MDVQSHRKQRLRELIDKRCNGVIATFASKIDRSESYVSRMLYPVDKKGVKPIADKMSMVIEDAFKLPRAWLDLPMGAELPAKSAAPLDDGRYPRSIEDVPAGVAEHGAWRRNPEWPFERVAPAQYGALSRKQKDHIEDTVHQLLGVVQESPEKSGFRERRKGKG